MRIPLRQLHRHLPLLVVLSAALILACGEKVTPIEVMTNEAGVRKERVGEAAAGAATADFVSPESLQRVRRGNVVGDEAIDTIVELPRGAGVQVRDGTTGSISTVPTKDYLTDFNVITMPGAERQSLVLYTYPNSTRGGTVQVIQLPGRVVRSSWEEHPPPGRIGVGTWKDEPSIFYIVSDDIIIRASDGQRRATVPVNGAHAFSRVMPSALAGDRTVVVASGDGYTPYHMVAIFDDGQRLLFHEQASEHAFQVTAAADGKSFDVETRTSRWRYHLP